MSDAFWNNLPMIIVALGTFLTTVISLFNRIQITRQGKDIENINRATNGMKDELVRATGAAEHARGRLEGKMEGKLEGKLEEARLSGKLESK